MTVQVNVKLNCSFLSVMSLQVCTYDCFCLQSFLAVYQLYLHIEYSNCVFELFSMCNVVST